MGQVTSPQCQYWGKGQLHKAVTQQEINFLSGSVSPLDSHQYQPKQAHTFLAIEASLGKQEQGCAQTESSRIKVQRHRPNLCAPR